MSFISKQFADELNEKAMRHAYLDAQTRTKVAQQIRALRIQREWSQAELGLLLGKPQSNVHRLEDRDVARYTLTTLLELAHAYDCGLLVEFAPYEEFLRRTSDLGPEVLQVPSFTQKALEPLWRGVNPLIQLGIWANLTRSNVFLQAPSTILEKRPMIHSEHVRYAANLYFSTTGDTDASEFTTANQFGFAVTPKLPGSPAPMLLL